MILRPFSKSDGNMILSWINDEREFYVLTGGTLGNYPITSEDIYNAYTSRRDLMVFIAEENNKSIGQFGLYVTEGKNYRICYVIVNKKARGKGLGTEMVREAVKYCFDVLEGESISLSVFKTNKPAFLCYKKIGFKIIDGKEKSFNIMGKEEACYEMILKRY